MYKRQVLTQINASSTFNRLDEKIKKPQVAIKSFLYRAPKFVKKEPEQHEQEKTQPPKTLPTEQKIIKQHELVEKIVSAKKTILNKNKALDANIPTKPTQQAPPKQLASSQQPINQVDTFTQLQNLRSKLNRSAYQTSDNPYQRYQPPSAFNANAKTVPHSMPIKDEEKERKQNTKNMGSGISTTKGDDGTCSISQDMSIYSLSEGSSTQYFACGESKFNKSFREHMKKVRAKLGKK